MIYQIPEDNCLALIVKWALDGCETLSEAVARMRADADQLDELQAAGWYFEEPVDEGRAEIVHDDPSVRYANWVEVEKRADESATIAP